MDHEKISKWLRFIITSSCIGMVTFDYILMIYNHGGTKYWKVERYVFSIFCFLVVLSKLQAFFMETHFNISKWKSSSVLPATSLSLIFLVGIMIFISSLFNWLYMRKKVLNKDKAKFKMTISFKTLYTIFGVQFLANGIIQTLIFLKGKILIFGNIINIIYHQERAVTTFTIHFTMWAAAHSLCLSVFSLQINKQKNTPRESSVRCLNHGSPKRKILMPKSSFWKGRQVGRLIFNLMTYM